MLDYKTMLCDEAKERLLKKQYPDNQQGQAEQRSDKMIVLLCGLWDSQQGVADFVNDIKAVKRKVLVYIGGSIATLVAVVEAIAIGANHI